MAGDVGELSEFGVGASEFLFGAASFGEFALQVAVGVGEFGRPLLDFPLQILAVGDDLAVLAVEAPGHAVEGVGQGAEFVLAAADVDAGREVARGHAFRAGGEAANRMGQPSAEQDPHGGADGEDPAGDPQHLLLVREDTAADRLIRVRADDGGAIDRFLPDPHAGDGLHGLARDGDRHDEADDLAGAGQHLARLAFARARRVARRDEIGPAGPIAAGQEGPRFVVERHVEEGASGDGPSSFGDAAEFDLLARQQAVLGLLGDGLGVGAAEAEEVAPQVGRVRLVLDPGADGHLHGEHRRPTENQFDTDAIQSHAPASCAAAGRGGEVPSPASTGPSGVQRHVRFRPRSLAA